MEVVCRAGARRLAYRRRRRQLLSGTSLAGVDQHQPNPFPRQRRHPRISCKPVGDRI